MNHGQCKVDTCNAMTVLEYIVLVASLCCGGAAGRNKLRIEICFVIATHAAD